ncbi:hypothetical protein HK099_001383, partial [Clydaea vesicula]
FCTFINPKTLPIIMEEVFIYEQSIDKSKKICSKMVNLLESFDDTLAVLETTILPIHKTTKIQTNLYNSNAFIIIDHN